MSGSQKGVFDPFLTFDKKGYLENVTGEKDLEKVKRMEHLAFSSRLESALSMLAASRDISYSTVLATHKILFQDFYHWAGRDRLSTTPDKEISKGDVDSPYRTEFERPQQIQMAFDYGLHLAGDTGSMRARAGTIMGLFAFAHPFLDGNGRTILLIHMELCFRAGFSIAWAATSKKAYLQALSQEIENPNKGILDAYLSNFIRPVATRHEWLDQILNIKGLDGSSPIDAMDDEVYVEGASDTPEMLERYRSQAAKRCYKGKD